MKLRAHKAKALAAIRDAGWTVKTAKGTLFDEYLSWHRQADTRRKWLMAEAVKTARAEFYRKHDGEEIERHLSALQTGCKGKVKAEAEARLAKRARPHRLPERRHLASLLSRNMQDLDEEEALWLWIATTKALWAMCLVQELWGRGKKTAEEERDRDGDEGGNEEGVKQKKPHARPRAKKATMACSYGDSKEGWRSLYR